MTMLSRVARRKVRRSRSRLRLTSVVSPIVASSPVVFQQVHAADGVVQAEQVKTEKASLILNDMKINISESYYSQKAPNSGAGFWRGTTRNNSGGTIFLTGHSPGDFEPVLGLVAGDKVTFCDEKGVSKSYLVESVLDVDVNGVGVHDGVDYYSQIMALDEERLVLETCLVSDGSLLRIVIAK